MYFMTSKQFDKEIIQRYCNKIDDNVIMLVTKDNEKMQNNFECLSKHLCDSKKCESCSFQKQKYI